MVTVWAMLSAMRVLWHLPLLLDGEMPLSVWLVGNAAFQMIVLQMITARGGRWSLAAVWHATLNAFGGASFFTMVTGADRARLSLLLSVAYTVVAVGLVLLRRQGVHRAADAAESPGQGAHVLAVR